MGVKLRQKNNDGKWWLMIHHKGQRSTRCLGRIDKRRAERMRQEVETKLSMNDLGLLRSQAPTVNCCADDWLRVVEVRCKPGTLKRYTGVLNRHVLPHIGHIAIDAVTSTQCREMMLVWGKRLNHGGAKTAYRITSALLNECVQDKRIRENPMPKFARVFGSGSTLAAQDKIQVIPTNELELILQHANTHLPLAYSALFTFLARTGCRLGEGLAIAWTCVNLQAGTADIRATYSAHYGLSSPKSGKSRRVALSPATVDALKRLKREMDKTYWERGRVVPEAVFTTQRAGNRIPPVLARKQWKRCLSALGLPGYRLHDLRHTFASRLLAMGESIKTVQMALGHHSSKMTLDVYGHLMPDNPFPNVAALDSHPRRTQDQKTQDRS